MPLSVFNGGMASGGYQSVEQAIAMQNLARQQSNPFNTDLSKTINSNFQALGMTFEEQFSVLKDFNFDSSIQEYKDDWFKKYLKVTKSVFWKFIIRNSYF